MKNKLTMPKLDNLWVTGIIKERVKSHDELDSILDISGFVDVDVFRISYVNIFRDDFDFIKKADEMQPIENENILTFKYAGIKWSVEFIEKTDFEQKYNLLGYIKFRHFCTLIFENEIFFYRENYQHEEIKETIENAIKIMSVINNN